MTLCLPRFLIFSFDDRKTGVPPVYDKLGWHNSRGLTHRDSDWHLDRICLLLLLFWDWLYSKPHLLYQRCIPPPVSQLPQS
ncbi:hypothetical protein ES703_87396 [subsurface metagenome]